MEKMVHKEFAEEKCVLLWLFSRIKFFLLWWMLISSGDFISGVVLEYFSWKRPTKTNQKLKHINEGIIQMLFECWQA